MHGFTVRQQYNAQIKHRPRRDIFRVANQRVKFRRSSIRQKLEGRVSASVVQTIEIARMIQHQSAAETRHRNAAMRSMSVAAA